MNQLRVLPIALLSITCLLVLKILGLAFDQAYIFRGQALAQSKPAVIFPEPIGLDKNSEAPLTQGASEPAMAEPPRDEVRERKEFANDIADLLETREDSEIVTLYDPITEQFYEVSRQELTGAISSDDASEGGNASEPMMAEGEAMMTSPEPAMAEGEAMMAEQMAANEGQPMSPDDKIRQEAIEAQTKGADGVNALPESMESGDTRSKTERKLLERLGERNEVLQAFEKKLRLREDALRAVEVSIESKIAELKSIEERVKKIIGEKDKEAEERIENLVAVYSSMKPKAAAGVFEQLDMGVLLGVVSKMKPKKLSAILGSMSAVRAKEVTEGLANLAKKAVPQPGVDLQSLPQVEGLLVDSEG